MSDETAPPLRLADRARTRVFDRDGAVDLADLVAGTSLGGETRQVAGHAVLVATRTQLSSAAAMVELDGIAARLVVAPPDLKPDHFADVIADAEIDCVVTDMPERFAAFPHLAVIPLTTPRAMADPRPAQAFDTEWALLTSGTSGRPKMVGHTLAALCGAISPERPPDDASVWATFYDIRRYGGLQIFLRALRGGTDLVLASEGEAIGDHLQRLGRAGVTHISGTPSHWRRVLMSQDRGALAPRYIRLSGEIADQFVLDGLRSAYPNAAIGHAYASTEAGVGFAVDDGRQGFPASLIDEPPNGLEMKIVDGTLRIRSRRTAARYIGVATPPLHDADGFVDTGDLVERRDDRYHFVGRRGGIINVGGLKVNPEEVESALNAHAAVRMSLVRARKNPLTGAIVVADVVLRDGGTGGDELRQSILDTCRLRLERHKVPALLRFVPHLALTPGGKLSRVDG